MNNLKFRAFHKASKTMHEVGAIDFKGQRIDLYGPYLEDHYDGEDEFVYETSDWESLEDYILLQSTGLRDKNDNEVFRLDQFDEEGIFGGSYIDYCDECKSLQLFCHIDCMACSGDVHWYEVIEQVNKEVVKGCLYELHPELLESKE